MAGASSNRQGRIGEVKAAGATYFATGTGYTAYATPTDLFMISGAADKVIRIISMRLLVHTTSGAVQTIHWLKRNTANTGGTFTTPSGWALDSQDAAHAATIRLYSVIPDALGTVVGRLYNIALTTATTTGPAPFSAAQVLSAAATNLAKSVVLRGANEAFCCNWNGAALPAGFTSTWEVLWSESAY